MTKQRKKKGPPRRSSAAIIGGNDDLLIELLIFIPAKFLVKFQLVSKQWQSVIFSQSFRRLHTLHPARYSNPHPSFILRHKITSDTFVCNPTTKTKTLVPISYESRFNSEYPYIKVLHSCNGLLLLECRVYSIGTKYYHVYNPTTLQSRNLNISNSKPVHRLCLAFDPRKSHNYRVVCFKNTRGSNTLSVSVYDSETREWKDVSTELRLYREDVSHEGVYWNYAIYFIRSPRFSLSFTSRVCYPENDGSVHELHIPQVPTLYESISIKHHLIESNGRMHCVSLSMKPDNNWLHVWELSEVEFSWSNVCSVSLNTLSASFGWKYHIRLLGLIRGTREEDLMVVFHVPNKIMTYNFAAGTFETLAEFTMEMDNDRRDQVQFQFKDAYQLVHTLSPV